MDDFRDLADAAHEMKALLRHSQRSGRFGREVRDDRVPTPEPRTSMEINHAGKPCEPSGYRIDPDAVATAIIDRLIAGRVLPPPS